MRQPLRLRVALGLLLNPGSPFSVSGYTSYTTRLLREYAGHREVAVIPWHEPERNRLGPASRYRLVRKAHTLLEDRRPGDQRGQPLVPGKDPEYGIPDGPLLSPLAFERIEAFRERLVRERIDVFHVTDWGGIGSLIFEACAQAGVPYVVSAVDHKAICGQTQLLEFGRQICDGPTSPERCVACLRSLGRDVEPVTVTTHLASIRYYLGRAERVVTFTQAHLDELDRWLGLGADRYCVIPMAVPSAAATFAKTDSAFARPLRFLYAARACHEWGLEPLLETWERMSIPADQALLEVHTDPTYDRKGFRAKFEGMERSGRITVSTRPIFDQLDRVYAGAAALVVPSQWKNTASSGALEALERSTPVITEDRHGVYEDLPAPLRELAYRSGDADDLARTLRRCIEEPNLLRDMSTAARSRRPFSAHAAALVELYQVAAAEPHATAQCY